jgi:hypothetical protein
VKAKPVRIDGTRAGNGYDRDQFEDPWSRYLPGDDQSNQYSGTDVLRAGSYGLLARTRTHARLVAAPATLSVCGAKASRATVPAAGRRRRRARASALTISGSFPGSAKRRCEAGVRAASAP